MRDDEDGEGDSTATATTSSSSGGGLDSGDDVPLSSANVDELLESLEGDSSPASSREELASQQRKEKKEGKKEESSSNTPAGEFVWLGRFLRLPFFLPIGMRTHTRGSSLSSAKKAFDKTSRRV